MRRACTSALTLLSFLAAAAACARAPSSADLVEVRVGRCRLHLERAEPGHFDVGLQGRTDLAADRGMLFDLGGQEEPTFWMKDTPLSLSLIAINADGVISEHYELEPFSEEKVRLERASSFVIEAPGGTFDRCQAEVGAVVPQLRGLAQHGADGAQ